MEAINLIEHLIGHFAFFTDGFVNGNRLQLAFDAHPIQFTINHVRHGVHNIFRNKDAHTVFLGETFKARRQIHRVAQHRVRTAEGRAHVADVHHAAIEANADFQLWPAALDEFRADFFHLLLHDQRRVQRMLRVLFIAQWRAPESHDRVADVFIYRAANLLNRFGHVREVRIHHRR